MTPEQAQQLLDKGLISQDTFDRAMAGQPPAIDPIAAQPLAPAPQMAPEALNQAPLAAATPTPLMAQDEPLAPVAVPEMRQVVTDETQTITSSQKKATAEANKAQLAVEKSFEQQKRAQEAQAQVDNSKAREAFNFNAEAQKIESAAGEEEQRLRTDANIQMQAKLDQLDKKTEELANTKYEGYWQKKATGDKIVGAISIALGSMGAALSGSKGNVALDIINKASDDDFRNYENATSNKIKAISESRLTEESKRKLIQDQIIGLQAKKQSDIKVIQSKIENLSNKFSSEETKAKLMGLHAQLDQKAAQSRLEFETSLSETVNSSVQRKVQNMSVDPITGAIQTAKDPERYVPGVGTAMTKDDAKQLKEAVIVKKELDSKLTEIIALRQSKGAETLDREAVGRGKQLSKQLLLKYKDLAKLGVLSESDMAIIEEIIPGDPLEWNTSSLVGQDPTMTKLQKLQTDVNLIYESQLGARLESREAPSADTKVVNGVTYQKVSGGWQKVR